MAQQIDFSRFLRAVEEDGHTHLVYISKDGTATTSFNNNHRHPVEFRQATDPVTDSEGRTIEEAQRSQFVLLEADGHVHDLIAFDPRGDKQGLDMSEEDTVVHVINSFEQAQRDEKESRELAEESRNFVERNEQWDIEDRSKLELNDRPALTVNKLVSRVNAMKGQLIATRTEPKWLPVESSDSFAADLMNMAVKDTIRRSLYDSEEDTVFGTELSYGRGLFQYLIDSSRPGGDIIIRSADPDNVHFSRHKRSDASDAKFMAKNEMVGIEEAKEMFPEKANKIQEAFDIVFAVREMRRDPGTINIMLEPNRSIFSGDMVGDFELFNTESREIRIIELQERVPRSVNFLSNEDEDINQEVFGFSSEDLQDLATISGFSVSKVMKKKLRVTRTVGNVFISQVNTRVFEDFDIVPCYAYKLLDGWRSWIEPAKDLQREINKRRSVFADMMNRLNGSGFFITSEMFRNPNDAEKFKNDSAKTGWVFELNNINIRPVLQQGIDIPIALIQSIQMDDALIDSVLNTPPPVLGQPGSLDSGIAFQLSRRQGLAGNQFLFVNLSIAKRILFTNVTRLIQKIWTPQRFLRLIRAQPEGMQMGGEDVSEMKDVALITEIRRVLNEIDLTNFDLAITETAATPTNRAMTFIELSRLRSQGILVPDEDIIEFMDTLPIAQKRKLQTGIIQNRQAVAEADKRKSDTEINKTLVNQGIIPPELQAKLSGSVQNQGGGQPSTVPQAPPAAAL